MQRIKRELQSQRTVSIGTLVTGCSAGTAKKYELIAWVKKASWKLGHMVNLTLTLRLLDFRTMEPGDFWTMGFREHWTLGNWT